MMTATSQGSREQEQFNTSLHLGSLIFDALDSPTLDLVSMLRTVITLLVVWRSLIPDESPWSVFKNYVGDGDDEFEEAELSPKQIRRINAAGFVFGTYMSFFDAHGSLHVQQDKESNTPDFNRAFDGLETQLSEALISAAVASADQKLARKEAEAAGGKTLAARKEAEAAGGKTLAARAAAVELAERLAFMARSATYLTPLQRRARRKRAAAAASSTSCAPHTTDVSLKHSTPADDGCSSTEGSDLSKTPFCVNEQLRYATAESALQGESSGTASANMTLQTVSQLVSCESTQNKLSVSSVSRLSRRWKCQCGDGATHWHF